MVRRLLFGSSSSSTVSVSHSSSRSHGHISSHGDGSGGSESESANTSADRPSAALASRAFPWRGRGRRLTATAEIKPAINPEIKPETARSKAFTSLAGVGVTSQAYNPSQQWVVLRSLATNTFVSVEPPPHAEAMIVHGRAESISLNNVFGFLRGGFLWSKSTASLLNICSVGEEVCTGYLEHQGDPHLKRLQSPVESALFEFHSVTLKP